MEQKIRYMRDGWYRPALTDESNPEDESLTMADGYVGPYNSFRDAYVGWDVAADIIAFAAWRKESEQKPS